MLHTHTASLDVYEGENTKCATLFNSILLIIFPPEKYISNAGMPTGWVKISEALMEYENTEQFQHCLGLGIYTKAFSLDWLYIF